jgi:hypothetical protein
MVPDAQNDSFFGGSLIRINIFATESTEEHEKINILLEIFPCSSVDSVAIN